MELGEFVKESIKQIIEGVTDAQKYAEGKGAAVNPVGLTYKQEIRGGQNLIVDTEYQRPPIPEMIDFDIAVSVTEGGEIKAGIGVFGGALGLGTQAKNEDTNTVANRIKFSIPILFPQQVVPKNYYSG